MAILSKTNEDMSVFGGGVILGVILSSGIMAFSYKGNIWSWMLEHEALAAGLIGATAALFTVLFLVWQIRQNYRIRFDEVERELVAARSVLPLVLSELRDYADECFETLIKMASHKVHAPTFPSISAHTITVLKECIRYSDEDERRALGNFVRLLQVQSSRLRDLESEYPQKVAPAFNADGTVDQAEADRWVTFQAGGCLYSTCELLMFINELWKVARPEEVTEPEGKRSERIDTLFIFSNAPLEDWPEFVGHFKRTADRRERY